MTSPATAQWSFPTGICIGVGTINRLRATCVEHGITRPLVVTDPGLVELPVFESVRANLADTPVFSDVAPNPVGANVTAGVEAFRSGDHDGVVAIGGGSALDAGKCIAFMSGQSRPMWDFEDVGDNWTRADVSGIAPVVAVPTTAGTGSEVGRAGVIIDESAGRKVIVFHPKMLPVAVIADPELTVGMPRWLTVGTGMDALSHSLEAMCAPGFHPMALGIAVEGSRLALESLPRAARDPEDLNARTNMMAAAAMGAVAFQRGLGAMHSLSHPIGVMFNTHHGMTNAVFMPYVLRSNRGSIGDALERVAAYCGIGGGADGFIEHIVELRRELDVPNTLIELGVDPAQRDHIVAQAIVDPTAASNPEPLTTEKAAAIFDAACSGNTPDA